VGYNKEVRKTKPSSIDDLIALNFSFHSKQLPIFNFIRREEKLEMIASVGTMFAYP